MFFILKSRGWHASWSYIRVDVNHIIASEMPLLFLFHALAPSPSPVVSCSIRYDGHHLKTCRNHPSMLWFLVSASGRPVASWRTRYSLGSELGSGQTATVFKERLSVHDKPRRNFTALCLFVKWIPNEFQLVREALALAQKGSSDACRSVCDGG